MKHIKTYEGFANPFKGLSKYFTKKKDKNISTYTVYELKEMIELDYEGKDFETEVHIYPNSARRRTIPGNILLSGSLLQTYTCDSVLIKEYLGKLDALESSRAPIDGSLYDELRESIYELNKNIFDRFQKKYNIDISIEEVVTGEDKLEADENNFTFYVTFLISNVHNKLHNEATKYSTLTMEELEDILEVEYEREDFDSTVYYDDTIEPYLVQVFTNGSEIDRLLKVFRKQIDYIDNGLGKYSGSTIVKLKKQIVDKVTDLNKIVLDRINVKYDLGLKVDYIDLPTISEHTILVSISDADSDSKCFQHN